MCYVTKGKLVVTKKNLFFVYKEFESSIKYSPLRNEYLNFELIKKEDSIVVTKPFYLHTTRTDRYLYVRCDILTVGLQKHTHRPKTNIAMY